MQPLGVKTSSFRPIELLDFHTCMFVERVGVRQLGGLQTLSVVERVGV